MAREHSCCSCAKRSGRDPSLFCRVWEAVDVAYAAVRHLLIHFTLFYVMFGIVETLYEFNMSVLRFFWAPKRCVVDETVLVSGAASGIGRLMCLELAKIGCRVVAVDLNAKGLEDLVKEINENHGVHPAHAIVCDVTDEDKVNEMAAKVRAEIGFVSILVNNAGIVQGRHLLESSSEKIEHVFRVNVFSHFWMVRAFLPEMIANDRGHIVTIASAAGLVGVAKLTDYCSSKWAAIGFHSALRAELKALGKRIDTTVVCPGYISTGMFQGARMSMFMPTLKPKDVSHRVVNAIRRRDASVYMPFLTYLTPLLKGLLLSDDSVAHNIIGLFSDRVVETIGDYLGSGQSMDAWVGRGNTKKND